MDLDNHTNHNDSNNSNCIVIWQQNVNKSRICQYNLISSVRLTKQKVDLVAL